MSLIRDVDTTPVKQKLVSSMVELCRDFEILTVAEGIETEPEFKTCIDMGCDLLQGFYSAQPGKPFPDISHG